MCEAIKGCVQGCAKLILILINVIALLAGVVMAAVGVFTMIKGKDYIPDVGVSLTPVAVFLIILGVLILFIGCFGCFGAVTGRHGLLNFYLILLLIIVVLEIAVLIFGFINKGKVKSKVTDSITEPFNNVNGGTATELQTATVASIQSVVECCGLTGGPDFWTNAAFNGKVPASCCANAAEDDTLCDKADAYTGECLSASEKLVKQSMTLSIIVIIAIIVFQIVCMILAACSKGEYTEVTA